MGVFGLRHPVIQLHGTTSQYRLEYSVVLEDAAEPILVTNQSPLNGVRDSFVRGYRWNFEVMLHAFKWTSDPDVLMDLFLSFLGRSDLNLSRFQLEEGGSFMRNKDDTDYAQFTCVRAEPSHLTQARQKDVFYLRFESNEFVGLEHQLTLP